MLELVYVFHGALTPFIPSQLIQARHDLDHQEDGHE